MIARTALVAERFRFFLDSVGLDREGFAEAVDGAVSARSLYSILNGTRRPSRALAVLIERQWGFRADYLLEGKGGMWGEQPAVRSTRGTRLTEEETEVIAFMRRSVDNARALARNLEDAELWSALWQRTSAMLDELAEAVESDSYPTLARAVFEDCIETSREYRRLGELTYERRLHHLITVFLDRFLREVPLARLKPAERRDLEAVLTPLLLERRNVEEQQAGIEAELRRQLAERARSPSVLAAESLWMRLDQLVNALARRSA
ncbi:MAG: hypothetical protein R3E82_20345 [Pseudomonadales bacterium]|nr:hypothetical protein [Pseudomonadales bacterium]